MGRPVLEAGAPSGSKTAALNCISLADQDIKKSVSLLKQVFFRSSLVLSLLSNERYRRRDFFLFYLFRFPVVRESISCTARFSPLDFFIDQEKDYLFSFFFMFFWRGKVCKNQSFADIFPSSLIIFSQFFVSWW